MGENSNENGILNTPQQEPTPAPQQEPTPEPKQEPTGANNATVDTPQPEPKQEQAPEPPALDFEKIKMPESLGGLTDSFKELAQGIGLNTENTQKVIDYYNKNIAEPIETARREMVDKWVQDSKSEFGDEGIEIAKKGYNAFATPALRQILAETGLANNPEIIRMFNAIGKKISEGKLVLGDGNAPAKTPGEILFSKSIGERK